MIKAFTSLRLPLDVKAFIEHEARENASSQNSEIVRAIRAAMKAKGVAEAATSPRHVSSKPSKGLSDEQVAN